MLRFLMEGVDRVASECGGDRCWRCFYWEVGFDWVSDVKNRLREEMRVILIAYPLGSSLPSTVYSLKDIFYQ